MDTPTMAAIHKLTDVQVKNAKYDPDGKKTQRLADGGGLYLQLTPTGRLWRGKFYFKQNGTRKEGLLALGQYPQVSLSEVRTRWAAAKALPDPRNFKKQPVSADGSNAGLAFEPLARKWLEFYQLNGPHKTKKKPLSPKHARNIERGLELHIFPVIGQYPLPELTEALLLDALQPVSAKHPETAARLAGNLAKIMRWAKPFVAREHAPHLAELRQYLEEDIFDHLNSKPDVENYKAVPVEELPEFKRKLASYRGDRITVLAMLFTIYTGNRTKETIELLWSDCETIDQGYIYLPAERMKAAVDHHIALSPQAIAVLEEARTITGEVDHVFPLSNNAMLYAMYRLGYRSRATVHGFRSLFSTVCNDAKLFSSDSIEKQLAHTDGNAIRATYNRPEDHLELVDSVAFQERLRLVAWWADWWDSQ